VTSFWWKAARLIFVRSPAALEVLSFPAGKHDNQLYCLSLLGQLIHGEEPKSKEEPKKVLSTDPGLCTVTLTDTFEARERHRRGVLSAFERHKRGGGRI
jgi:hypothetical protein